VIYLQHCVAVWGAVKSNNRSGTKLRSLQSALRTAKSFLQPCSGSLILTKVSP